MDNFKEEQDEEREVLESIFEGDSCFNQVSPTCFQYKYGEDVIKSFVAEVSWGDQYPSEIPNINLDVFHNSYLPEDFRNEIKNDLIEQAKDLIDTAMTYSLFDWMKEKADDYLNRIPEIISVKKASVIEECASENHNVKSKKDKKEQLTKAQKRKITEQTNYRGERERGWDWVDIVRHLSQTGVGSG